MRRIKQFLIIILSLASVGCENEVALKKEILKLQSREITIPFQHLACYEGVGKDPGRAMVSGTILIYVDSTSCNLCSLNNLPYWDHFNSSLSDDGLRLQIVPILAPCKRDIPLLSWHLKHQQNTFNVYMDTIGLFHSLNPHVPSNNTLHTFLLDNNNQVLLAGDPMNNKEMQSLYMKTAGRLKQKQLH